MDIQSPHVIISPYPAQGHIKPMLILAELLTQAGFTITFITTEHSQRQLLRQIDRTTFSKINFVSFPDGLPDDHPRAGPSILDLFFTLRKAGEPVFKDLVGSMSNWPACIICDGIMAFPIDLAAEMDIPVIVFRTYNATCTWVNFHLEKLIEEGEIPVLGGTEDMDRSISCIPGLENIIRRRDLPNICRLEPENPFLQYYITQNSIMAKASRLILNTFEELEPIIISHLRSIFPTVYAIGPLHATLKSGYSRPRNSSSLIQVDNSCIEWLDSQETKSVLYVSFGSVIFLALDQLMEFWYGLVNSGKPFLWAIRPDLLWDENGTNEIPEELKMGTEKRDRIVGWAPQEEVLAHKAVGGFLTHSGWNSTLECIFVGKPMICWPMVADQLINSRCVSDIWKIGFDMKDVCDRLIVERMIRDLMEGRREEIIESMNEIAILARHSIRDGGSSYCNLKRLIEDIKSLHLEKAVSNGNSRVRF